MYARDLGIKKDFYASLGLDAKDYDQYVINKTNETSARVFPVVLDVYDKSFYGRLDKIVAVSYTHLTLPTNGCV